MTTRLGKALRSILRGRRMTGGRGRLYVIGTGPAGPKMATLQALETIKKMDVILAPRKQAMLFIKYIGTTPVLFDPWQGFFDYNGKKYHLLEGEELTAFQSECFRLRDERVERIRQLLSEGKDVGLLDAGNPCVFGPSHWYIEQFDSEDMVILPGVGAIAAGLAALEKSIIPAHDTRYLMETAPFFLMDGEDGDIQTLKDADRHNATVAMYMALDDPDGLFERLARAYPADMPCAAVYWAGFPFLQRTVEGTIGDMAGRLSEVTEEYMGILFIGRFLDGKPYEAAMHTSLAKLSERNRLRELLTESA